MENKTTPSKVKRVLEADQGKLSIEKKSDGMWYVIGPGTQFWDKTCLDVQNFHSMPPLSWKALIQKMSQPVKIDTLHRGKATLVHLKKWEKDNSKIPDGCLIQNDYGGTVFDPKPFRFRFFFEAFPPDYETFLSICKKIDLEADKVVYTSKSTGLRVLFDWLVENQFTTASDYLSQNLKSCEDWLTFDEKMKKEGLFWGGPFKT